MLASLIAALEVTGADRIVLRPGELPQLIRGDRRHPLSSAGVLTVETIEQFVDQALSPDGKQALTQQDFVVEALPRGASSVSVLVAARRTGRDIYVELRSERGAPPAAGAGTPQASANTPRTLPATPQTSERHEVARAPEDRAQVPAAAVPDAESPAAAPRPSEVGNPMRIVATQRPTAPSAPPDAPPTPDAPPAAAPASEPGPERTPPAAKSDQGPLTFKRRTPAVGATGEAALLEQWIEEAVRHEATALYLRAGQVPVMRVREGLRPVATEPLHAAVITAVLSALAAPASEWQAAGEGGWTREFAQIGPVRCQTFTDTAGAGLAVLLSPHASASQLQKEIPRQVRRICEKSDGLVIVAAATPSAVMRMAAALAETTAQQRAGYLISIEPPGGLGHTIGGPLVSARRIGGTEQDVVAVIRRAADEGPDVLVVAIASGAIADAAVRAAASGCLVIVGVIAPTAHQAIEALAAGATRQHEAALRRALAASFQCAFSYRTIRGTGGRSAIVHDVVLGTSDVRARIEYGDFAGVQQLQRAGGGGMYSLDAGLAAAVLRGNLSLRQAAGRAGDRSELVKLVRQGARHRRMARASQPPDTEDGSFRAVAGDSFTT